MAAPLMMHLDPVVLHDTNAAPLGVVGNPVVVSGGGGTAAINKFTGSAPIAVSIPNVSTALIGANANRKWLFISPTTPGGQISLGLDGNPAVLGSGITVFTGTPVIFDVSGLSAGPINAISNIAGGVNVAVQEGV